MGFAEGELNAEIMGRERNSIGDIMLAKESAVSPGITCENGAGERSSYKAMTGTETL
jgi:hypothetical protein